MTDARSFLAALQGQELRTAIGRWNRVIRVESDQVVVATSRSPSGRPVPVRWVQDALDRLESEGSIEISVESVGHRSAFIGAALRELPRADFVEGESPPRIRLLPGQ